MQIEIKQAQIEFPIDPAAGERAGYRQRHIQIRLTPEQSEALFRLRRGAAVAGVRLQSGKEVTTSNSAIAWLLEQISARV